MWIFVSIALKKCSVSFDTQCMFHKLIINKSFWQCENVQSLLKNPHLINPPPPPPPPGPLLSSLCFKSNLFPSSTSLSDLHFFITNSLNSYINMTSLISSVLTSIVCWNTYLQINLLGGSFLSSKSKHLLV